MRKFYDTEYGGGGGITLPVPPVTDWQKAATELNHMNEECLRTWRINMWIGFILLCADAFYTGWVIIAGKSLMYFVITIIATLIGVLLVYVGDKWTTVLMKEINVYHLRTWLNNTNWLIAKGALPSTKDLQDEMARITDMIKQDCDYIQKFYKDDSKFYKI